MEKRTVLTGDTLIPVGILTLVFGAAAWITAVYAQGDENARQIAEIKQERKDDMEYIRQELKEINQKLDEVKNGIRK